MEKVFENEKFTVEVDPDGEDQGKNELLLTVKATGQTLYVDADREGVVLTGSNGDRFCVSLYIGNDPEQLPWIRVSPCKA